MNTNNALSVTQLNRYIKSLMEADDLLHTVAVRAEISNLKVHTSGHLYFTLKDAESEISAVMFRSAVARLSFEPRNGMRVTVYGSVSVYEKSGKYQLYASAMVNDGAGQMYEEYMRLLKKLSEEGLFAPEKKKKIPTFPKRIGIVTSPTGAAIRDMINVTGRRYPSAEIIISPALVQGAEAPRDLCRALSLLDAAGECDCIIIGRGGGSAEDLWAFNDEALVRVVAACSTPVISAVGHETDTTLCDYAADLRAPTPSAAAELCVPDRYALLQTADALADKMSAAVDTRLSSLRTRVGHLSTHIKALSPDERIRTMRSRLSGAAYAADFAMEARLKDRRATLSSLAARISALDPLSVVARGYSIATDSEGVPLRSVERVSAGENIKIRVSDGSIDACVVGVTKQKLR